jgi:3',5'-cyclic AMP phosphodiesterase CpdA
MRPIARTLVAAIGLSLASGCHLLMTPGGNVTPVVLLKDTPASKIGAAFPNQKESLKFAVLGDFGSGTAGQYAVATRMAEVHSTFPYELVLLAGDNMYGTDRPQDYENKFEIPYKLLLDAGVKFYASLGNHDSREQRTYKHFNMEDKLYYSFKAPKQDVRFYALESTYPEPDQIKWLEEELKVHGEKWKIVYMHHPLYSSGGRHGSDVQLRETLEPLFIKYGVSVVFTGHDHIYERTKPQHGITYFVAGSGGMLRPGDFNAKMPFSEKVNAETMIFLAAEILNDTMTFKAITREGKVADSGEIPRRVAPEVKEPVK